MQSNPLGHSARTAKGAQTAYNKGVNAAKAGKLLSDCPYKDSPGDSTHVNFGRKWRRKWNEGYQSVKRGEPLPP
jgi:hypothetical protein